MRIEIPKVLEICLYVAPEAKASANNCFRRFIYRGFDSWKSSLTIKLLYMEACMETFNEALGEKEKEHGLFLAEAATGKSIMVKIVKRKMMELSLGFSSCSPIAPVNGPE